MLNTVDLSLTLDQEEYNRSLVKYQVALFSLAYQVYLQQRPVVIVFEGWDAAGKGRCHSADHRKTGPAGMSYTRLRRPRATIKPIITCGVFGGGCPKAGRSQSSTGAGMAV